jgi:hypothetical protein
MLRDVLARTILDQSGRVDVALWDGEVVVCDECDESKEVQRVETYFSTSHVAVMW